MSLAFTKDFLATNEAVMILGKDGNRKELTVFNLSDTDFVFIGFGNENDTFNSNNTLPLAPGESYDASVVPLNAVFLMSNKTAGVQTVVYYSTSAPSYVKGRLIDG